MEKRILFQVALLSASIINLYLAMIGWRRRRSAGALAYCGLMLAFFFYSFGYAIELGGDSLAEMLSWLKVEYIGISFIPAFWLLMTLQYTEREDRISPYLLFVIFGLSFATYVFSYTNQAHYLFYKNHIVNSEGPFPILYNVAGPGFYLHVAYTNISLLIGNVLLLKAALDTPPSFRKQTIAIMLGSFIPWAVYWIDLLEVIPWGFDPTPLTFPIVGLICVWNLFRYQLFDLLPVARQRVFESMGEGVIVLDNRARIVDYNPAAGKILKLTRDSIGDFAGEALSGYPLLKKQLMEKQEQSSFMIAAEGNECHYDTRLHTLLDRSNRLMGQVLVIHDITEHIGMVNSLEKYSRIDDLTGLYNRRYFIELSEKAISRANRHKRNASLIIFDLDHLKEINDTLGHKAGDVTLTSIARACQSELRNIDIFGRYGGDEFAIFLPDTASETAFQIAERLRLRIAQTKVSCSGADIYTTASFGISELNPVCACNLEEMIKNADEALYAAKNNGRNCINRFAC